MNDESAMSGESAASSSSASRDGSLARYISVDTTEARVERVWGGVAERLSRKQSPPGLRYFGGALAMAAVMLALFFVPNPLRHDGEAALPLQIGAVYKATRTARTLPFNGDAELQLAGGTEIEVAGLRGTQVERLVLRHGRVECELPPKPGRRFSLIAGRFEVRVVGTRFSVESSENSERIRVAVERGRVEVHLVDGSLVRTLSAGESWTSESLPSLPALSEKSAPSEVEATPQRVEIEPAKSPQPAARAVRKNSNVGPAAPAEPKDAKRLLDEANVARRSGDAAAAAKLYDLLLTRFPQDGRAGLAAFELGRLRMDRLADLNGAIRALKRAVTLAPSSGFREDAMARLVRAYGAMGASQRCEKARGAYLRRYPKGVHAAVVKQRCR